jgi:sugar lactone lactonase YvrE
MSPQRVPPAAQSDALIDSLAAPPSRLGESPFWHPSEQCLYWCDINGRALHRHDPTTGAHSLWGFDSEPGSCAPLPGGDLLLALRDGLVRFDPTTAKTRLLAKAPYDRTQQRFNDGKADASGAFWVGTIHEPRDAPRAALYRYADGELERMGGGVTVSNGLAFSPDGRTLYWSDTTAHTIYALDMDLATGQVGARRVFAQFPDKLQARQSGQPYGGRPDGAAVDAEGCYWVAMYEGGRLLRLSPAGELLQQIALPVLRPTMPAFGVADLRTLYVTSAAAQPGDPAQPLAGCVLRLRADVPGLPVHFAHG